MSNTITVTDNGKAISVSAKGIQGPSGVSTVNVLQAFTGNGTIGSPLDFSAFKVITQPSDLLLYGTYAAGVYTLPTADRYYFKNFQDYGTDRIEVSEQDGIYAFDGSHFDLIQYTGTGNFISTADTGISLNIVKLFISAPNGTAISMINFNSCILEFPVFVNCKQCVDLDTGSFFTNEVLVMVICQNGAVAKDVGTMSARIIQWSVGQNIADGTAITLMGAASERCFISQSDSRPQNNEHFLDIQSDYGGLVDIVAGVHTSGGGGFFKVGSRDQTDGNILVTAVQNVADSKFIGNIVVIDNNTATVITTQNDWFDIDFDGSASESSNIERWTLNDTSTVEEEYIGNQPYSAKIEGTFSVLSPGSQNYEFRYVIDRGAGFVALPDAVDVPFATDSATGTFPLNIPLSCVTGDKIKPQVRNIDGTDNITIIHLSAGPANQ